MADIAHELKCIDLLLKWSTIKAGKGLKSKWQGLQMKCSSIEVTWSSIEVPRSSIEVVFNWSAEMKCWGLQLKWWENDELYALQHQFRDVRDVREEPGLHSRQARAKLALARADWSALHYTLHTTTVAITISKCLGRSKMSSALVHFIPTTFKPKTLVVLMVQDFLLGVPLQVFG